MQSSVLYYLDMNREEMIVSLLPLCRSMSWNHKYPAEALSDAYLGAIRAVDVFDPSRGVPLGAFARKFIRGSIINGPRDRRPAGLRSRLKTYTPPMYIDARIENVVVGSVSPDATVIAFEESARVAAALDNLPPREQAIVRASYFDEQPDRAIAQELGRSPQRVCQLRHQALARLRAVL
jgi:RNA polymerase sigma factor (sigma-70 family)